MWLLGECHLASDLHGVSVLDVGACNGGASLEMAYRGADVTAVELPSGVDRFGLRETVAAAGLPITVVPGDVCELSTLFPGAAFDIVLFLGVLYHLRHPLLALDNVSTVTRTVAYIETAVCPDNEHEVHADFHLGASFHGDVSNWFVPTPRCAQNWVTSAGLHVEECNTWGEGAAARALVRAVRKDGT